MIRWWDGRVGMEWCMDGWLGGDGVVYGWVVIWVHGCE
jgi:hypothetical protein